MRNITKITEYQAADALPMLGVNLLKNIEPEMVSENGGHPEYKTESEFKADAYKILTSDWKFGVPQHIDIFSENFTLTYDLGKPIEINRLFVSGYWHKGLSGIYMLGKYELHVGNTKEEMYTENSLVVAVDNTDISLPKTSRLAETFFDCEGVKGRFVGIKMLKANITDNITRLARIGAYNNKITEQQRFLENIIDNNFLTSDCIALPKGSKGCAKSLTNGSVFDTDDGVVLGGDKVVLTTKTTAEYLTVTGAFEKVELFSANELSTLWDNALTFELTPIDTGDHSENCNLYKLTEAKKYIGLKLSEGDILEQLGLYTYTRKATVDTDNIKTRDFIGIGANDLPMALMPESRMQGFRNVYWPVYCFRFAKANPSVVRVWFQVDWVVTEEENYKQGICNFKSDKMRQFLPYMDAYEAAGIEVEFNFGWKASTEIQDWFSIPSQGPQAKGGGGKAASAPKDFDGFAKCCASTIRFLIEEKGYTCLKYLTFYNEANFGDKPYGPGSKDFGGYPGKAKEMWEHMLRTVDKELTKQGLKKYIQYWVPEVSGKPDEIKLSWVRYMMENCREFNSLNSFHYYGSDYNTRIEAFKEFVKISGNVGAAATEFAVYTEPSWEQSNIEYVMSMLHSGIRGGLYWCLQTVKMTDPTWLYLGRGGNFWLNPPYEKDDWAETRQYHEFCLFTRYLPRHSSVLETYSSDQDIRIETVVTPDGNYTVFVESNAAKMPKNVEITFSSPIGKIFRKHIFKRNGFALDGNLTIPKALKEIEVGNTLKDTIDTDYQLVCYTTIPAFGQIKLNTTSATAPIGGSFKFEAELIDCSGELAWELVASDGAEGTIDQNGLFTLPENARSGDIHAIKVSLKDHPETHTVALIKAE